VIYRIVRHDKHNWRLEKWTEGGRAPGGKMGAAKWKGLESYHPTLRNAALALLDYAAGDALLTGEAMSINHALELAEARVIAAIAEVTS